MKLFYNIQTIYNMKKRYKIVLKILIIIDFKKNGGKTWQ